MNWHLNQLKYAMGLGGIMSFYGIVALIVWFSGDYMGYRPSSRVVVIALVLITMPFALIIGYVSSRRQKKSETKPEEQPPPAAKQEAAGEAPAGESQAGAQKLQKPTGSYEDIEKTSAEVVQFLKDSKLGDGGKDSVYSLPWYLVAGTPKSGKSSLVIGSRLNFQNLPSQRQSELKFVRPTRGVDWRVTSDAVFIDTAGRYQTEGVDQDEWASLIETVKKHRPQRPIDGFLLVVNAEQIIESRDSDVEQMAKVLRARLDEAMERTKVRFPVYLIFTHADSIEGFRDSFSRSKQEGKNLVWGSTIPLEKSENGQSLFDSEYGILHDSVMKRRILRLSAPFPPVRQLRIFNFPLHFGAARRKIGAFVSTLFRPNPFSKTPPFLRGFYFTSALSGRNNGRGGRQMAETVGTTYFTERFFRDVILRDKDLVRATQLEKKRPPMLGWGLTGLAGLITIFLLTMSAVSLFSNKQLLNDSVDKGRELVAMNKDEQTRDTNPLDKKPEQVQVELDKIDDLRDFLENNLDKYNREGAPLYLRFGFYSGDEIYRKSLLPNYLTAIELRFERPMIDRIKADLKKFAANQPAGGGNLTEEEEKNLDKHYKLLKAYLMLTKEYKDKADPSHLSETLKEYWINESKIPPNLRVKAENQLNFWATQVDREEYLGVPFDEQLVSDTRARLKAFPAANRVYKTLVDEVSRELEKEGRRVTVDNIVNDAGADANLLEGDYEVKTAYTREGYALLKKKLAADERLDQADWVMGEESSQLTASESDKKKVEDLYLADYADEWTEFVKRIRVKKLSKDNIDEAQNAMESFSSNSSPISAVTREIARNTNFSGKTQVASGRAWYNPLGWWEAIQSYFDEEQVIDADVGNKVEDEFRPLFDLFEVQEEGKRPKIETYEKYIGDVAAKFNQMDRSDINRISRDMNKEGKNPFPELKNSGEKIDQLLKNFKETTAGIALANFYKQPLDNLKALFGADNRSQIERAWSDGIVPEAKKIEQSYPFAPGGAEINIRDLNLFLNPVDGKLSTFYKERLSPYFEGEDENIKPREGSGIEFSPDFVSYLQNAFRLRKALYGSSAKPEFRYGITLQPAGGVIIEGTIDGKPVKSQGTGSANLTFPAASGENGVIIRFDATGEPVPAADPADPTGGTDTAGGQPPAQPQTDAGGACRSGSNPVRCPGTWGLFKFFDAGSPSNTGNGYKLTYGYKGKTNTILIRPDGGDLFDKRIFTSVKAPQSIYK